MSQATHTYEEWQQIGAGVDYPDRAFIDGELVPAQSGKTYECINPTTGQRLAVVAECGPEDVDRAVQAARKSFEDGRWSEAGPADRKAVMLRLAELIRENGDELAVLETMNMGKTVEEAAQIDIPGAADLFQWYAETSDKLLGEVAPTGMNDVALVTREPLGVVAAVTPWNQPLLLATWKAAPALIAGNSLVLKPAEQAPHSSLRLGELAIEAGLPPGCSMSSPVPAPQPARP